jgi:hypothetical protein
MSKRAVEQDHRRPTRLTLMKSNISDDLGNIFAI